MIGLDEFTEMISKLSATGNDEIIKELMESVAVLKKKDPGVEQIIKAQNIINNAEINPFVYIDKPYLLTTQNQNYLNLTLPQDSLSACVVLGAGDTVFELILRGIKNIVAIDTNDLQQMVYKLRRASIMTLSAKDFEKFLVDGDNYSFMSKDIFKVVKDGFDKDDEAALNFWKNMFVLNPREDLRKYLFKGIGDNPFKTRCAIPYLKQKKSFYELRDNLESANIVLKNGDILNYFEEDTSSKFDYIDITNVLLFIYQLECNKNKDNYCKKLKILKHIFENNLNAGGTFVLDYWFGVNVASLRNIQNANKEEMLVREIYDCTYQNLNQEFELETFNVDKLIDGFGKDGDTVLLTKKIR